MIVLCLPVLSPAQEERRIEESRARLPIPAAPAQLLSTGVTPEGSFIITPDDRGQLAFDMALAYSLQRALDSARGLQSQYVKGVSAAVLVPGQGVWQGVSGISSLNPAVAMQPAMMLGIASNSKAFISTTILSLVDEGKIGLDDPLSKYLPAQNNITMSVTIRQLLNMTSGLFDYLNDGNAQGQAVSADPTRYWSPEEIIASFVGPSKALPGGPYSYCNTDYILLGMVIKAVTGKSVASQIRERILTPLALDDTYLEVDESHTEPIAHPWDSGVDFMALPVTAHFSTLWTAGGIISTAENMARWVKGLHEGAVISPSSWTQLNTYIPTATPPTTGFGWYGYGLGIRLGTYYGKTVRGHTGAIMGYISITGYLPGTGASFVVLFNASEATTTSTITALLDAYLRGASVAVAQPGVCYALGAASDSSRVFLADSATAGLSAIGAGHYGRIIGARVHPKTGALWGITSVIGWELVQIDGETGEAFPRSKITFPTGAPTDFKGLEFLPDGTLYVGAADGRIYAINTATGVATLAITSKISISGLAIDPLTGALWASPRTSPTLRDRLYRIDPATGDTTGIGNTGFNQPVIDLAFDGAGNLFGLVGNPSSSLKYRLARIDKSTAVGREIGSVGQTGIMSIAFSPGTPVAVQERPAADMPSELRLEQNYPNPFNPATRIGFTLPGPGTGQVKLGVYDVLGKEVALLVDGQLAPGSYSRLFDATGLASGLYIYRLTVAPAQGVNRSDPQSRPALLTRTQKAMLIR
jgi:D-alanyl-D-alanine carboxypeptidase